MSNARLGELERRLSNTIRPGTVLEADYEKARIRVTMGDNTSAWLPWLTSRAGEDRTWHAPEVGEQVIVMAPGGELSAGYVMPGGIYKNDYPANGDKPEISRTTYKDGAVIEYNRETHSHAINIPAGGRATITVGGDAKSVLLVADGTITAITGQGSIIMTASGVTTSFGSSTLKIDNKGINLKG